MQDTLNSIQVIYHLIVQADTFGRLAPKQKKVYKGFIVYAKTAYGQAEIIDSEFKNLDDSPWLHEHLNEFIFKHSTKVKSHWGVYKWVGTYELFKNGNPLFKGKIKKMKLS